MKLFNKNMHKHLPALWVRLVAAVLLPVLFLSMIGVPLPVSISKNSDERYPCENCVCSCGSAAACWDRCCCHTDEEKLVWAEKNHVQPPKFVVDRVAAKRKSLELANQVLAAVKNKSSEHSNSCCSNRQSSKCKLCGQSAESCTESSRTHKNADGCKDSCDDECRSNVKVAVSYEAPNASLANRKSCEKCKKTSASGLNADVDSKADTGRSLANSKDVTGADPIHSKAQAKKLRFVLLNSALKCKGIQLALIVFSNCLPAQHVLINIPQPTQIDQLMIENEKAGSIFEILDDPVPRG